MAARLYTSKGSEISLGTKLGTGGEGAVFEVKGSPLVAKLYHEQPDPKKQAKLAYMAQSVDAELLKYAAWPQETLHPRKGGPVVGFLMGRVTGKQPIHEIYSPAHRRQEKPHVAWDFLLFVARNTAAAFETLHGHGHVLGDVNQGNLMVGDNSQVILIDSDSFQINAQGTVHLCEVGVGHFTPPELQGLSSFRGVTRTPNHDNFGLALLIFHLLFGGRHPYAGVPLKNGVGDQLETDIKAYRYAYGRDAQSRGLKPPPRSIPVGMLPSGLEQMFFDAFTEAGSRSRPKASQWVTALDALRQQLKRCSSSKMHVFPGQLSSCPWCDLEKQGVAYFIDAGLMKAAAATGFVLARVWAAIEALKPPPPVQIPLPGQFSVTGMPLPANAQPAGNAIILRGIIVALGIVLVAAELLPFVLVLFMAGLAWIASSPKESLEYNLERIRRRAARDTALAEYQKAALNLKNSTGPDGFQTKKAELRRLYLEHQDLPELEKRELAKLKSTGEARQREQYLERFFIDKAQISGVGPARKAALRSFGIETAADVTKGRIRQVKGFGEGLTRAMLDWRASCEKGFKFNPATAVTDQDRQRVRAQVASRRMNIESSLSSGLQELTLLSKSGSRQLEILRAQADAAAQALAQAEADLSVCV